MSNDMNTQIRKAANLDIENLIILARKTISAGYRDFIGDQGVNDFLGSGAVEQYVKENINHCRVISLKGKVVGYAVCKGNLIDLMMIDNDFHRQGIGTKLLNYCEKVFLQNHAELTLESFEGNHRANNFYKKNGWTEVKSYYDETSGVNKMVFRKKDFQKKSKIHIGLIKAIIVLPGTVLVFIPAIILIVAGSENFSNQLLKPDRALFWLALLPACLGLGLAIWTVRLFMKFGNGTPAPWEPPQKLVVRGPYRHVRNPMISGVLFMLMAEALLFQSWPIAIWMAVFFVINTVYFPLVEEKDLVKRFGDDYQTYKNHVPRWIPRLRPWIPDQDES